MNMLLNDRILLASANSAVSHTIEEITGVSGAAPPDAVRRAKLMLADLRLEMGMLPPAYIAEANQDLATYTADMAHPDYPLLVQLWATRLHLLELYGRVRFP